MLLYLALEEGQEGRRQNKRLKTRLGNWKLTRILWAEGRADHCFCKSSGKSGTEARIIQTNQIPQVNSSIRNSLKNLIESKTSINYINYSYGIKWMIRRFVEAYQCRLGVTEAASVGRIWNNSENAGASFGWTMIWKCVVSKNRKTASNSVGQSRGISRTLKNSGGDSDISVGISLIPEKISTNVSRRGYKYLAHQPTDLWKSAQKYCLGVIYYTRTLFKRLIAPF